MDGLERQGELIVAPGEELVLRLTVQQALGGPEQIDEDCTLVVTITVQHEHEDPPVAQGAAAAPKRKGRGRFLTAKLTERVDAPTMSDMSAALMQEGHRSLRQTVLTQMLSLIDHVCHDHADQTQRPDALLGDTSWEERQRQAARVQRARRLVMRARDGDGTAAAAILGDDMDQPAETRTGVHGEMSLAVWAVVALEVIGQALWGRVKGAVLKTAGGCCVALGALAYIARHASAGNVAGLLGAARNAAVSLLLLGGLAAYGLGAASVGATRYSATPRRWSWRSLRPRRLPGAAAGHSLVCKLAWRLGRSATILSREDILPAEKVEADSELVMFELASAVDPTQLRQMRSSEAGWRTVEVEPQVVIVQLDTADRALRRRINDVEEHIHALSEGIDETEAVVSSEPFLLHDRPRRLKLWLRCFQSLQMPVDLFSRYFGEHISVYFDFVESYIKALQPVALGGLALWLLEARWPDSRPAVVANTVYRAVISVWSLVVVRQLDRRQQRQMKRSTSKKWSSLKLRVSKIPAQVPTRRRVWLYLRSVGVTAGMLAVAFGAVVSCLNLQGLMNPDHTGALWVRRLRIERIARLSGPGAVFDAAVSSRSMVPLMLHSCLVAGLNRIYRSVAIWLTEREGHGSPEQVQNHVVLKRVFFETIDGTQTFVADGAAAH